MEIHVHFSVVSFHRLKNVTRNYEENATFGQQFTFLFSKWYIDFENFF